MAVQKGVLAPIIGVTRVPHFKEAIKAVDLLLTDEDETYLKELYAR